MGKEIKLPEDIIEISAKDGVAFIEQASPLTRLHYFDGKFLRADAFAQEQDYHRTRTRLSNLAGGWGAVNGLGIALSGNQLTVSAGLAITAAGNFVLANGDLQADLAELLKVAAPAPLGGSADFDECLEAPKKGVKETAGLNIYEITVGPVEGLCGNEAVYGKLCESACVSSSQHPYWREGVVLRLRPVKLKLPGSKAVALSAVHLRNRVASAYFAAEPWLTASGLSAAGLASELWCNPASLYGRDEVVIGLLVRDGGVNRAIDSWGGRRERMDTQARGYWQGRMAMRPWNVFIAQILQFQCQLSGLFGVTDGVIKLADDCGELRDLLEKTRKEIELLHKKYSESTQNIFKQIGDKAFLKKDALNMADQVKASYAELYEISEQLNKAELGKGALPKNRMLLNAGFVELPPAGYLPVVPGKADITVQLQRMFGEGVRLHYRAARADVLPHLVEEAQHMERISLTQGLDDPRNLEQVEIFVPDGEISDAAAAQSGTWWQVNLSPLFKAGLQILDAGKAAEDKIVETGKTPIKKAGMKKAPAAGLRINTNINVNTNTGMNMVLTQDITLDGLARTEARQDGSYGVGLVAALDTGEVEITLEAVAAETSTLTLLKEGAAPGATDEAGNVVTPNLPPRDSPLNLRQMAVWLAGDIATDPFKLSVGEEAALKLEMRVLTGVSAIAATASGTLTVLGRQSRPSGATVLQVAVEMVSAMTLYGLAEGPKTESNRQAVRLALVRRGDAQSGALVVDDPVFDEASPALEVVWDDTPRTASVALVRTVAGELVADKVLSLLSYAYRANEAYADANTQRRELLSMDALPAAPDSGSRIGSAALNALVKLADATDDPAFLARARRRLFPQIAASGIVVKAVEDWVMFRRLRPTFCEPVCIRPVQAAVEAFQVWHLRVASAAELKALQTALDKNDPKALAAFKFRRVGILRYRDESATSEESATRVHAMWEVIQPAAQVALARVWEPDPGTGQGWQNHFRVRNMLEQIADLTRPPARGDGVIAALPQAPVTLADGALDGGMLVVTMDAVAQLKPHRTILVPHAYYANLQPVFEKNPDDAWQRLNEIVTRDPNAVVDLSLVFNASNQMDSNSVKKLLEGDAKMMSGRTDFGYQIWIRRIDAALIDGNTDPVVRHKAVSDNVGKNAIDRFDEPTVKLQATDLGGGAQVASVVFYLSVVET